MVYRQRSVLVLTVLLLTFVGGMALADTAEPDAEPQAPAEVQLWSYELMPVFQSASEKYNVPLPLLLAVGYIGSDFENRGAYATIEGGYGMMALRKNNQGGTSLAEAAALLNATEEDIMLKGDLNIMGAAAVLDKYAKMWQIDRGQGLDAWLEPLIKYAALDPQGSRMWAMEIYELLQNGLDTVNSSGQRFTFDAQNIGSIKLSDLMPQNIVKVQSSDYGPAIWYGAASCNYTASYCAKDTVVIHTTEGSCAGTLSWMNNCSAQVSSHYVVSKTGTVYQMVNENYKAWHVSCYNSRSLGIEHEGYTSQSSYPQAQLDASALLTRHLCDRWGIPKQKTTTGPGIIGHIDVTRCCCGTHTDPGDGWNWSYYISQVQGAAPTPTWAATYSAQSYPTSMTAGSTATAWVEYKNTGTGSWTHGNTRLGTSSPQDRTSPFYNSGNWVSANRPTDVDQSSVGQNSVGRFSFVLKAPTTPGTYTEHYKLVQEGVTWFGDEVTWTIAVTAATGNITGTVRNSYNGQAISGAPVAISGGPTTTTNSSGSYTFTGLSPATYTISVSATGFNAVSGSAAVTAGNTTTKDFNLTSTDTTAPTTPSGLTATAVSPSRIDLTWTASTDSGGAGLAGYIIYRGCTEVGRTTDATFSNNGLAANTAYDYTVKAYDNAGNTSAASNSASATTMPGTVPIFEDGFANTSYWQALVEGEMSGPNPPSLVADNHDHSQFSGGSSLKTINSTDGKQGCLIGHTFDVPFATAKFESYFFDGTGLGYIGDFENGTDGWVSYTNAYGTLTTTGGGVSGNCMSVSDGGWTGGSYKEFTSGFTAGETYWLTISEKVPSPATWGTAPYAFVRFFDSAGAQIGSDAKADITADNAWHSYSVTGTIPSGAAKIWIGQYMYLNATSTYTYCVDNVSFTTSTDVKVLDSRQGLQVRCVTPTGDLRGIYYVGTYSPSPGSRAKYSAGYYKLGTTGWLWPGANCADRSPGWHKLTIDFQPYTGSGDEVKFLIDGTQVATAERTLDTQTYGLNMVAYGHHYRVNMAGWFDDCAMYAAAPVAPTIGTPTALSSTSIRWSLTDNSNNEMGFRIVNAAQAAVASAPVANGTGSTIYADETDLAPNTAYTRFAQAYNGSLDSSPTANATRWTLSVAPTTSTVICDKPTGYSSSAAFKFTAVGGFGQGTVQKYLYAWDTSPTHTWTGLEAAWNSADLILNAEAGSAYYLHVRGYNGENVDNGTLDLGPYQYKDAAPTNPTSAVETHGAQNGVWQSTVAAPSFTWTGASDASGIAGYMVYLGSDETGTSTTYVTSAEYGSAALETGTYYLRVCAKDNTGTLADEWATLFTFKYDSSAPSTPVVADDGPYTGSKMNLHGTWLSSDADSDIAEYQYAVGTSAGATDALDWRSAGTSTEAVITIPDPGLALGNTYYISVKAKNGAGVWSEVASSDGIQLAPDAETIAKAKAKADGTPVALTGKMVTASFPASFYIEEYNRTSGIMVLSDAGYNPGTMVTVGGVMGVNSEGERAIEQPVITIEAEVSSMGVLDPLFITGASLGGSAFNSYTAGKAGGVGLNNVGLLVKVCGSVLTVGENEFTITDGSSTGPLTIVTAGIEMPTLTQGDFVSVVGVSSLRLDTILKPIIRVNDGNGINKLN